MGPISHRLLPTSHIAIARRLAYQMVQIEPDYDVIRGFFWKNAIFKSENQAEMNRDQFVESLRNSYMNNVREIKEWFNSFDHIKGSLNGVVWCSNGTQYLLGTEENNQGYGYYNLASIVNLKFQMKNGAVKISEFNTVKMVKKRVE